jgi:hypothetical protein
LGMMRNCRFPIPARLRRPAVRATSPAPDITASCRESTYELRMSALCRSPARALRERAFIELKSGDVHRPISPYAPGFATLRRYASCLGHSLEVRLGEDHRLILTPQPLQTRIVLRTP